MTFHVSALSCRVLVVHLIWGQKLECCVSEQCTGIYNAVQFWEVCDWVAKPGELTCLCVLQGQARAACQGLCPEYGAVHWLVWQFRSEFLFFRDFWLEGSCYSATAADPCWSPTKEVKANLCIQLSILLIILLQPVTHNVNNWKKKRGQSCSAQ